MEEDKEFQEFLEEIWEEVMREAGVDEMPEAPKVEQIYEQNMSREPELDEDGFEFWQRQLGDEDRQSILEEFAEEPDPAKDAADAADLSEGYYDYLQALAEMPL